MGCYVSKKVKKNIEEQELKLEQLTQQNKELLDQVNHLKKQHESRKPLYLVKDQELDDLNVFKTDLDRRFLKLKEHIELLNRENGIIPNQTVMDQLGSGLAVPVTELQKSNHINEEEWKKIVESKHDFIILPYENFDLSKVEINIQLSQKQIDFDDSKKEKSKATQDKIEKQDYAQDQIQEQDQEQFQSKNEDQQEEQIKKSEPKYEDEKFNQPVENTLESFKNQIKGLEEVKIEVIQEDANEDNYESKKKIDQERPRLRRTPEEIDNELQAVMQDPKLNLVHEQVKSKMFKEKEKIQISELYKTSNDNKVELIDSPQIKTDPQAIKTNSDKMKQQQSRAVQNQRGQRQSLFLVTPNKQTPKIIDRKTSKSPTVLISKKY